MSAATATLHFPVSLEERLALGNEEQHFPASLQEFADLLEVCDYQIEYQDHEIIAMSIASDPHETIVANFLGILHIIFKGNPHYRRYGSNRHIFLPEYPAAYSPDASVVKGLPEIAEYSKGKTANLNPWLLLEVLSESTRLRDLGEKLTRYKKIPSAQVIVFVEQGAPFVTVFEKEEGSNRWSSKDYDDLSQSFYLGGKPVLLADIYENVQV
jgi:Uma2 family endonuclease